MLNEQNRADDSETTVFDLMIYGICRGWLPAPAQSANESGNGAFASERMALSPTTGHGSGVFAFSRAAPAIVVIAAIAIIASIAIRLVGVDGTTTSAVPNSTRRAAMADDLGATPIAKTNDRLETPFRR